MRQLKSMHVFLHKAEESSNPLMLRMISMPDHEYIGIKLFPDALVATAAGQSGRRGRRKKRRSSAVRAKAI